MVVVVVYTVCIVPCCLPTAETGDPMTIDKVVITPDPPVKGQGISVLLAFTLGELSVACLQEGHSHVVSNCRTDTHVILRLSSAP